MLSVEARGRSWCDMKQGPHAILNARCRAFTVIIQGLVRTMPECFACVLFRARQIGSRVFELPATRRQRCVKRCTVICGLPHCEWSTQSRQVQVGVKLRQDGCWILPARCTRLECVAELSLPHSSLMSTLIRISPLTPPRARKQQSPWRWRWRCAIFNPTLHSPLLSRLYSDTPHITLHT